MSERNDPNHFSGFGRVLGPWVQAGVTGIGMVVLCYVIYQSSADNRSSADRQDARLGVMVEMAAKQAQLEREIFQEITRRQWEAISLNQRTLSEVGRSMADLNKSLDKHEHTSMEQLKQLQVIADHLKKNGKN